MSEAVETPLTSIVTTDLAGITRGRPVPAERLQHAAGTGVGWVPANIALTPFGGIADPNPWGSTGDLRLLPDLQARYRTDGTGSATPFDIVMANIVELDGTPWRACPRHFLCSAVAAFKAATGLQLRVAFEHEFLLGSDGSPAAHPFSVEALRRADPFPARLFACLEAAGVEPEMVLAEYGADQFEVTHAPADPLRAADRAVAIREITREVARLLGRPATFTPKPAPDAVGSGVHVHLSLMQADGAPASYDALRLGGLSEPAGAFCAGILRHMPGLLVFTASSVVSYLRLVPHSWSASWTSLGDRDREAALRICPTMSIGGRDPAKQYNVEFRAADATANPYLVLGVLIRAGLVGIKDRLSTPPLLAGDPAEMDEDARQRAGLQRLPQGLDAALAAFGADPVVQGWFDPAARDSFVAVKQTEIALMREHAPAEICARYRAAY